MIWGATDFSLVYPILTTQLSCYPRLLFGCSYCVCLMAPSRGDAGLPGLRNHVHLGPAVWSSKHLPGGEGSAGRTGAIEHGSNCFTDVHGMCVFIY